MLLVGKLETFRFGKGRPESSLMLLLMKKLVNKKEIENLIPANLRITSQETVFQEALRTVLPLEVKAQL